jgi:hypothetical protein
VGGLVKQPYDVASQVCLDLERSGTVLAGMFARRQDAGFGFNYEKDPNKAFVLIGPGRTGLTARQILDRLLGRG